MELTSSEAGRLTDESGQPMPYEVTVSVAVGSSGPVRITGVELRPIGRDVGITRQSLDALSAAIDDFADYAAARAIARWHAEHGTPLHLRLDADRSLAITGGRKRVVDSQPVSIVLGPRHVADLQEGLGRRRKGAKDPATYERVAEIYRKAQSQQVPVRDAVGAAFFVGPSQADKLIREARRRGLLPPARRGRRQDVPEPATTAPSKDRRPGARSARGQA